MSIRVEIEDGRRKAKVESCGGEGGELRPASSRARPSNCRKHVAPILLSFFKKT